MNLLVDSVGPDQTAQPRSLILAFTVHTWNEGKNALDWADFKQEASSNKIIGEEQ